MLARTVSLLLIGAVVVCPLWCGVALCQCTAGSVSQACASGSPPHGGEEQAGHPQNREAPADLPVTSCQGVCSGAVIEKPRTFHGGDHLVLLRRVDTHGAILDGLGQRSSAFDISPWQREGNAGRMLRTLHRSLLC